MQKTIIGLTILLFSILSTLAVWHHGYLGIFESAINSFASVQIFCDLAISLSLFIVWMWKDARETGRQPWFWLVVTLTSGSFGPLIYLFTKKEKS